jgi:hypothetical protein
MVVVNPDTSVIEVKHEISSRIQIGFGAGVDLHEEVWTRLPESANHRYLSSTLPEPLQHHPPSTAPTASETTFCKHQKPLEYSEVEACTRTNQYRGSGGNKSRKVEHAAKAMSGSSLGEPSPHKLQSKLDNKLVPKPAEFSEDQVVEEFPAEDIVRFFNLQ